MKKGQITMFLVVGMILALVVGIFIVISLSSTKRTLSPSVERSLRGGDSVRAVELFVQECLESSSDAGLREVLNTGGVFPLQLNGVSVYYVDVNQQGSVLYSRPAFLDGASRVVENKLAHCLDGLSLFSQYNVDVSSQSLPQVSLLPTITDTKVLLDFPVSVILSDRESSLQSFSVSVDVPLESFLVSFETLISSVQTIPSRSYDPSQWPFLSSLVVPFGMGLSMHSLSNTEILYTLTSQNGVVARFVTRVIPVMVPSVITVGVSSVALPAGSSQLVSVVAYNPYAPVIVSPVVVPDDGGLVVTRFDANNFQYVCVRDGAYTVHMQAIDTMNSPVIPIVQDVNVVCGSGVNVVAATAIPPASAFPPVVPSAPTAALCNQCSRCCTIRVFTETDDCCRPGTQNCDTNCRIASSNS